MQLINKNNYGDYRRALETERHIFFFNYKENTAQVFTRKMKLIHEGDKAYDMLIEAGKEGYTWISEKFVEYLEVSK